MVVTMPQLEVPPIFSAHLLQLLLHAGPLKHGTSDRTDFPTVLGNLGSR